MNLPETIKRQFSEDTVLQMADILTEPSQRVRNAVASAVPAILAAVAQRSTQRDGQELVAELVHQRDPQLLERFPGLLRERHTRSMIEAGSAALLSLLGKEKLNSLIIDISRSSSLSTSATGNLTGLITPVIFATIARYAPSTAAAEISSFLVAQTETIRDAIPQQRQPAPKTPVLEEETDYDAGVAATSFDDAMHGEAAIPRQEWVPSQHGRGGQLGSERPPGAQKTPAADPRGGWIVPILILLSLVGSVIWLVWPRPANEGAFVQRNIPTPGLAPQATNPPSPADGGATAQPAGSRLPAGNTPAGTVGTLRSEEVLAGLGNAPETPAGRQLASILDDLAITIGSIRDEPTARSAATKLKEINQRLDQVEPALAELPAGDRSRLRAALQGVPPRIESAIEPLGSIPGVQTQVRPLAALTVEKFDQLSK